MHYLSRYQGKCRWSHYYFRSQSCPMGPYHTFQHIFAYQTLLTPLWRLIRTRIERFDKRRQQISICEIFGVHCPICAVSSTTINNDIYYHYHPMHTIDQLFTTELTVACRHHRFYPSLRKHRFLYTLTVTLIIGDL